MSGTRDTKRHQKPFQEDVVVHSVEGGTDIQECEKCHPATIDSGIDVREHSKDSSLGRVAASKPRLKLRKQVV